MEPQINTSEKNDRREDSNPQNLSNKIYEPVFDKFA
jgi:hypothetical protein